MNEEILLVASYIAALYEMGLCPENVANSMAFILTTHNLWDSLIEIEKSEGGYEKYVSEH